MKKIYNVGIDKNTIELKVEVGTPGIAFTSVRQRWSGGVISDLKESDTDSGDIELFIAGKASDLKNSYLIIQTFIDFGAIDSSQWNTLKNTLSIKYILNGGFSGSQQFNHEFDDIVVSHSGKLLAIIKPIELIQK